MIGWRDYGTDNIRHSKIFVTIRKLLLCDFFLNQERNKMRKKTHKVVLVVGEEERERERERDTVPKLLEYIVTVTRRR